MSLTINHNLMALNTTRNLGSHYGDLATATRRLSSGLRVGTAADDAAGLAVRELMRADIASLGQGIRNINDAISTIQVADGALQVIDEKLIRMKELATQAATGTYTSDQRAIIDSEFQAMAHEINRISASTEFNGIKLLNGNLAASEHDGSALEPTGKLKVHFGPSNSSLEDFYHIQIGGASLLDLKLGVRTIPLISDILTNGAELQVFPSGIVSFSIIPSGSKNIGIELYDNGANDTIQIFSVSGRHIVGTKLGHGDWDSAGVSFPEDMNTQVLTPENGFSNNAVYVGDNLNGIGDNLPFSAVAPYNQFTYNGMNIGYSGDGNPSNLNEYLTIDEVTEDLIVLIVGAGVFSAKAKWDYIPSSSGGNVTPISISTQELAQQSLEQINTAITYKDTIRAHLGAMQNRLENTATNLQIQTENLQAAESRISDTDMAHEMTALVKGQILAQGATAMLAQANTLPRMALELIQG